MPNVVIYVVTPWYNLPNKTSPVDASALNHIETGIKNVTDFINTLNVENGKVMGSAAFTTALLNKLNGIEEQANKYILPVATNTTLGGVKVDGSTIVIEDGVIRATTSGITELEELSDVNLTDLADGQILKYDSASGKWVNTSEAEVRTQLSLLEDVDIDDTSLEDGQVLKYNGTSEKWENGEGGDVLGYDETLDILGLPPNPIYRFRELIPEMTSNTTPSGVASAKSTNTTSGYEAYRAFDGNGSTRWTSLINTTDQWIQYKFDNPKVVSKIKILAGATNIQPTYKDMSFVLQGSNDGTLFTDLKTGDILAADNLTDKYIFLDNEDSYLYYRLQFTGYNVVYSGGTWTCILELQMYEKYLA